MVFGTGGKMVNPYAKSPFPAFGGKSAVADLVWSRFGRIRNFIGPSYNGAATILEYYEPFANSIAMLLANPDYDWEAGRWTVKHPPLETINDIDPYIANFWRAVTAEPDKVAHYANWPVNECVPAGTMIATPDGNVPVEQITVGMVVWGYDGEAIVPTTVIATKQSVATESLVKINDLLLTGNHPVWTKDDGYVEAAKVSPGMKIGTITGDFLADKLDLIVLQYEYETEELGNLHIIRPQNKSGALCRGDIPGQEAIQRTSVPCCLRGDDPPRLLDSFTDNGRSASSLSGSRAWNGRWVAGCGAQVDCLIPKLDESHGRGRGCAWLCANTRTQGEMVEDADRCQVCDRARVSNAWEETHTGGCRENPSSGSEAQAYRAIKGEAVSGPYWQGIISGTSGQVIRSTYGQDIIKGTQAKDSGFYHQQKNRPVHGNGAIIPIGHNSSQNVGSVRGIDQSGDTERGALQRVSPEIPVTVYNFQTTTENYFANRILVHNCDLHARHRWLVAQTDFREQMKNDPDYHDCKIAGWWVWGACLWIGGGWCATEYTPRNGVTIDGSTEERRPAIGNMTGVHRASFNHHSRTADGNVVEKRPLLGHGGRGVHRPGIEPRPHLSGTGLGINGRRISKQKPMLNGRSGIYVPGEESLQDYFEALSKRLRRVRTLCGDWERAVTDVVSWNNNSTRGKDAKTAFFFDPPYAVEAGRTDGLYAQDDLQVAHQVREWCLEWVQLSDGFEGYRYNHPKILIALCGYEDEHGPHMPDSWECVAWKAQGGYSNQRKGETNGNKHKERIWFSPNCLKPQEIEIVTDLPLFQFAL